MSSCQGFTRARMLRDGVAAAGKGLPAIEPGMPAPAGSGLSRRSFLARSLGTALAVYGAGRTPLAAFEEGIAHAAGPDRTLVSVFFSGGLDSLSVLAPVTDPRYLTMRPTLALTDGLGVPFSEDPRLMWNPAAGGLRTLHAEGKVSVLPAVGSPAPDGSHFTSRHHWEIGELSVSGRFGWLGRWLDAHGTADNPLQGLSLDWSLSPALAAATNPVASVPYPDDYGLWTPGVGDPLLGPTFAAIGALGALPTDDPARRTARRVAGQVDHVRQALAPFQDGVTAPGSYPSGAFGRRLRALAGMLAAGLPIHAVAIQAPGGYDTHSNQASTFGTDLRNACDGLLAFQRDLEARGIADRVLVHGWSEFGRRPEQNDTGTDHGAAGLGFVVGTRATGTMVGEYPGLSVLDPHGNLRATTDFRSVYCSLLEQWLGADAEPLIPGAAGLARPALVAA